MTSKLLKNLTEKERANVIANAVELGQLTPNAKHWKSYEDSMNLAAAPEPERATTTAAPTIHVYGDNSFASVSGSHPGSVVMGSSNRSGDAIGGSTTGSNVAESGASTSKVSAGKAPSVSVSASKRKRETSPSSGKKKKKWTTSQLCQQARELNEKTKPILENSNDPPGQVRNASHSLLKAALEAEEAKSNYLGRALEAEKAKSDYLEAQLSVLCQQRDYASSTAKSYKRSLQLLLAESADNTV